MGRRKRRVLYIVLAAVLLIILWIIWCRRDSIAHFGNQQKTASPASKVEEKTVYVDGTKIVQVSEGDTVTNLTTVQNIQQNTNILANTSSDTLASLACSSGQIASFTGSTWACANQTVDTDTDTDTDQQDLSLTANQLSIQNGSSVDLSIYLDNTDVLGDLICTNGQIAKVNSGAWTCQVDNDSDNQTLNWNSGTRELSLTSGGSVTISDNDTTYSAGSGLSLIGTQFNLDPDNLSAISSVANSDVFVMGTSSGPQKISYNDLFGNILGALNYRGTWNAGSNTPDLTAYCEAPTKGHYYVISGAGNTVLDSFTDWQNNDWAICNGTSWQKIESLNTVSSVFGRSGSVTAQNGDYNASQITFAPNGTLSSTNVQTAIQELRDETISSSLADSQILIGNGSNQATAVNLSGDLSLTNTGITTINSGSVNSAKIADGSIQTVDLANDSIMTSKISDGTLLFEDWNSNGCTSGQIPKFTGSSWACANDIDTDTDTNTDQQTLALAGNQLSITSGNSVNLSTYLDNTDTQDLSWDSNTRTLSLNDGGSVVISDSDTLKNLNCSNGEVAKWNGSAWACATDSNTGTTYSAGTGVNINGSNIISSSLGVDVDSSEIVDGTVATADLANNSITSGKILDSSIVSADIADGTVTFADMSSNGCTEGQVPYFTSGAWSCANIYSSKGGPSKVEYASNSASLGINNSTFIDALTKSFDVPSNSNRIEVTFDGTCQWVSNPENMYARITVDGSQPADTVGTIPQCKFQTQNLNSSFSITRVFTVTPGSTISVNGQVREETTGAPTLSVANRHLTIRALSDGTDFYAGSTVISGQVATGHILDGTVLNADIANDAITTGKILDGTILSADIADGTVTFADWSSNSCISGQIPQYNGTAWVCTTLILPKLGFFYAETNFTTTNTSFVDITPATTTYTVPAGSNRISVTYDGQCTIASSLGGAIKILVNGAAQTGVSSPSYICGTSDEESFSMTRMFNVTPGSTVTIKAQGKSSNSGTSFSLDNHQLSIIPGMQ